MATWQPSRILRVDKIIQNSISRLLAHKNSAEFAEQKKNHIKIINWEINNELKVENTHKNTRKMRSWENSRETRWVRWVSGVGGRKNTSTHVGMIKNCLFFIFRFILISAILTAEQHRWCNYYFPLSIPFHLTLPVPKYLHSKIINSNKMKIRST